MRRKTRGLLAALLGVALALAVGLVPEMAKTARAGVEPSGAVTLLEEDFESRLPPNWDESHTNDSYVFQACETLQHDAASADGSYMMGCGSNHHNVRNSTAELFTPTLDLSGRSSATLSFSYANPTWDGDTDGIAVGYQVGDDDIVYLGNLDNHGSLANMTCDLPAAALAENVRIVFAATCHVGYGVGIDDVKVTAVPLPTYEVTYKVANGTWSDGGTEDKTEDVRSGSKPASVPTGMKAAEGYEGGAWDTDPAEATITEATTFTYTFTKKAEPEPQPEPVAIPDASVTAHVQRIGWMDSVTDGTAAGTTGKSRRMEALTLKLPEGVAGGIEYRGHVQRSGWENAWAADGAQSGTTGKSRRVEAVQIQLTGEAADAYDVYYRVHVQRYGWMAWAKNGEETGTQGMSRRAEAIQVVLVRKDAPAPDATYKGVTQQYDKAFVKK